MSGTSTPGPDRLVSFERLVAAVERAAREGVSDSPALRAAIAACARAARDAAHPPQIFIVCVKASVRAGALGAPPTRVEPLMSRTVGHAVDAYYATDGSRAPSPAARVEPASSRAAMRSSSP